MNEIREALLKVAQYLFDHAEMWNAWVVITHAPELIKDDIEVITLKNRIKARLDLMHEFATKGRRNSGFVDPPNVTEKVAYNKLKEKLEKLELNKLVDVGCFSGWLGRNLSIWGFRVHGIDIDPEVIQTATYLSSGTRATFEVLTAEQLGAKYPKTFDGAVLFDLFEHLFDPLVTLQSVELSVKDDGWVFINLPNAEVESTVTGDDRYKEHLHTFSEKTIDEIFGKKKNFTKENIENEE